MLFLIKKTLSPLFLPLTVSLLLLLSGCVFLWFAGRRKAGRVLVSVGLLVLVAFAYPPLPNFLARSLESRYPPIESVERLQDVPYVAVLGGGNVDEPERSAADCLKPASLRRLMEGVKLYRGIPGCRLILTGGAWSGGVGCARTMGRVAREIGVPARDLIICDAPLDTREEAEAVMRITGTKPFLLVTSAMHMPRSMFLFERAGMHPIPAPADYTSSKDRCWSPEDLYPESENLIKSDKAVHEYLGILWARLRG